MLALAHRKEQYETCLVVLNQFSLPSITQGATNIKEYSNEEQAPAQFSCFENGCLSTLIHTGTLKILMIIGHYELKKLNEGTYDQVRRQWGNCCNELVINEKNSA